LKGNLRILKGDLLDPASLKAAAAGIDTIFHLAAKTHAVSERADAAEYERINVSGTSALLDAARNAGASKFIFFSSVKTFGERTAGPFDETSPAEPTSFYGKTKLRAESLVLGQRGSGGPKGICLRLPLVYGPKNKGNIMRMLRAVDKGYFPNLPHCCGKRSLVHVDNVVAAARLAAIRQKADNQIYIVSDDTAYSAQEIYSLMRRALGKNGTAPTVPVWALRVLARAGDVIGRIRGDRFPIDSDSLSKITDEALYTSEKIKRDLGYRPQTNFKAALPDMVAWYREENPS
jgi:nucleoside-diphosphate-sugar epimerase